MQFANATPIDDTGIPYMMDDYTETRKVPTQYKVFYNIALFCGLCKGELLALHWDDIDFEKNMLTVSKSVAKTENGVGYKCPKTKTSIRTVLIPKEIIPLSKQYRKDYNLTRLRLGGLLEGERKSIYTSRRFINRTGKNVSIL